MSEQGRQLYRVPGPKHDAHNSPILKLSLPDEHFFKLKCVTVKMFLEPLHVIYDTKLVQIQIYGYSLLASSINTFRILKSGKSARTEVMSF